MKKILLSLTLTLLLLSGMAQNPVRETSPQSFTDLKQRLMAGKNFNPPNRRGVPILRPSSLNGGVDTVGGMLYNPINESLYLYTGGDRWIQIAENKVFDGLFSGGNVTWSGVGLIFDVSPSVYYIRGVRYTTSALQITLTAADVTNPRIDIIGLDSTGLIKLTGTPASNPAKPQVRPISQIELTSILLPANATEPITSQKLIFDENVEYTTSTSGPIIASFGSTTTPFHGTKTGEFTSSDYPGTIRYTAPTPDTLGDAEFLKLYIKLTAPLTPTNGFVLVVQPYPSAPAALIFITDGAYGFSTSLFGVYQSIVIPVTDFGGSPTMMIDYIDITPLESIYSTFFIDYIYLQGGISPPPTTTGVLSYNGRTGHVVSLKPDYSEFFVDNRYQNNKGNSLTIDSLKDFTAVSPQGGNVMLKSVDLVDAEDSVYISVGKDIYIIDTLFQYGITRPIIPNVFIDSVFDYFDGTDTNWIFKFEDPNTVLKAIIKASRFQWKGAQSWSPEFIDGGLQKNVMIDDSGYVYTVTPPFTLIKAENGLNYNILGTVRLGGDLIIDTTSINLGDTTRLIIQGSTIDFDAGEAVFEQDGGFQFKVNSYGRYGNGNTFIHNPFRTILQNQFRDSSGALLSQVDFYTQTDSLNENGEVVLYQKVSFEDQYSLFKIHPDSVITNTKRIFMQSTSASAAGKEMLFEMEIDGLYRMESIAPGMFSQIYLGENNIGFHANNGADNNNVYITPTQTSFGPLSNMIWDNVNARLGINVTPAYTFDVTGDSHITGTLLLENQSGSNRAIHIGSNAAIPFTYSNTLGNIVIGDQTTTLTGIGSENLRIGRLAGGDQVGEASVFIGNRAGIGTTGRGNLFLGAYANYTTVNHTPISGTVNGKFMVAGSPSPSVGVSYTLMYGDFTTRQLIINPSNTEVPTIPTSVQFGVNSTTAGFLPPRMTGAQMNAISSPIAGLFIWNTDSLAYCGYNGTIWRALGTGGGGGGVSYTMVFNEEFTGSTSSTLTIAHTALAGTTRLYKNGVRLPLAEFSVSGTTVTLTSARVSGDLFTVDYNY